MFRFAFPIFALVIASLCAPQALAQPLSDSLIAPDPEASAEDVGIEPAAPPAATGGGEPEFYRIRVGDTLTISVLEDPNLTRTVLVRPDGRVSLPIAGSVLVAGVSPEALENILQQRFARGFQITPTVTVSIRGLAAIRDAGELGPEPLRFYVMGSAARTGPFETVEQLTVLEALAVAGGPGPFAAVKRIQIRRLDEDGVEQIMLFNYRALQDGLPVQDNVTIEAGDIIYVPERGLFE